MQQKTDDMLAELISAEVEFVVVGGVAAVMQGASHVPSDLDIVYRRTLPNAQRLLRVLQKLDAGLDGDENNLMGRSDFHLLTTHGKLDLLTDVNGERYYEDLLPHSVEVDRAGYRLKLLGLPMLIKLKEEVGRENDIAALPVLREAFAQQQKR